MCVRTCVFGGYLCKVGESFSEVMLGSLTQVGLLRADPEYCVFEGVVEQVLLPQPNDFFSLLLVAVYLCGFRTAFEEIPSFLKVYQAFLRRPLKEDRFP